MSSQEGELENSDPSRIRDPWPSRAGTDRDAGERMRCFEEGLSIFGAGIWAENQGLAWMEGEVREKVTF